MLLFCREISGPKKRKDGCSLRKLFDFLKKKQYNYRKRVASKRKSSLPAARFYFAKSKYAIKKCVACQRKSSLYDRVRTFFVPKREELKQNGRKQQDEGDAGE